MPTITSFELAEALGQIHESLVKDISQSLDEWCIEATKCASGYPHEGSYGYVLDRSLFNKVIHALFSVSGRRSALEKWDEVNPPNSWVYKNSLVKSHEDLLEGCIGFVYRITYKDGKKYIGKKIVVSERRLKPTKAQLAIRKNYVRKELVKIPFAAYEGSHDKEGCAEILYKEILYQCSTKRTCTYLETDLLFATKALFDENYLNQNISGTFYDNALDGILGNAYI